MSEMSRATVESRFWAKVNKTESCWIWTGNKGAGYGRFALTSRQFIGAHRYAYELLVGPIPAGFQLDHLCRTPACVNPDHLEPVTMLENIRRAKRTHCKYGHEFTPENSLNHSGWRECRTCRVWRNREYEQRRKARKAASR